ncbi:unnamed protein product [Polarella glacialis]|uniref:C3H1-type domain-containing protein n=1 Tax=Polarella glacialis TaxID=89957 RepID=A0A813L6G3_POLGL|nr:unnamed protein product [Polarella glacialis]
MRGGGGGAVKIGADAVAHAGAVSAFARAVVWRQALSLVSSKAAEEWGLQEPIAKAACTAAIAACDRAGVWEQAVAVISEMLDRHLHPSTYSLNAVLSACGRCSEWEQALGMWATLEGGVSGVGTPADWVTSGLLVRACERAGQWANALALFEDLGRSRMELGTAAHNAAVSACALGRRWADALDLLRRMDAGRVPMTRSTRNSVLRACDGVLEATAALSLLRSGIGAADSPEWRRQTLPAHLELTELGLSQAASQVELRLAGSSEADPFPAAWGSAVETRVGVAGTSQRGGVYKQPEEIFNPASVSGGATSEYFSALLPSALPQLPKELLAKLAPEHHAEVEELRYEVECHASAALSGLPVRAHLVGSRLYGVALAGADVDLVLELGPEALLELPRTAQGLFTQDAARMASVQALLRFRRHLESAGDRWHVEEMALDARRPTLRMRQVAGMTGNIDLAGFGSGTSTRSSISSSSRSRTISCGSLAVEVTFDQSLATLRKSELLARACAVGGGQVRQVALVLRIWAAARGLTGQRKGYPSGYAFGLMALYFCQRQGLLGGLSPKAREELSAFFPSDHGQPALREQEGQPSQSQPVHWQPHGAVAIMPPLGSPELDPVLDLGPGLFAFFARDFDWYQEAVSVTSGGRSLHPRSTEGAAKPRKGVLWVEDPVEAGVDLAGPYLSQARNIRLRAEFRRADRLLRRGAATSNFQSDGERDGCFLSREKAQVRAEGRLVRLLQRLEEDRIWSLDELSSVCEELVALGSEDWPEAPPEANGSGSGSGLPPARGQELWARLGSHLLKFPDGQQQRIVTALGPLRGDVCKKMVAATDALNIWLSAGISGKAEIQNSKVVLFPQQLVVHLLAIDQTPQLRCYRQCGDLAVKTRFLVAIAAAVRAAQDPALLRPCLSGHPSALVLAQRIASSFFTVPSHGNVLLRWHEARLDRYDLVWCLAAGRALELFRDELQERLVASLLRHRSKLKLGQAMGSDVSLRLSPWPMVGCPLAAEFISFIAEKAPELDEMEPFSVKECPVHSLRPAPLLRILEALDAFEVEKAGRVTLKLIRLRPAFVPQIPTQTEQSSLAVTPDAASLSSASVSPPSAATPAATPVATPVATPATAPAAAPVAIPEATPAAIPAAVAVATPLAAAVAAPIAAAGSATVADATSTRPAIDALAIASAVEQAVDLASVEGALEGAAASATGSSSGLGAAAPAPSEGPGAAAVGAAVGATVASPVAEASPIASLASEPPVQEAAASASSGAPAVAEASPSEAGGSWSAVPSVVAAVSSSAEPAAANSAAPVASSAAVPPVKPKLMGFGATSFASKRPGRGGKGVALFTEEPKKVSRVPLPPKLIRRSIDWRDTKYLERLVQHGLAAGDAGWKSAWEELCKQKEVSADFAEPPPTEFLVQFVEGNLYQTTGKDWARELLYKREGEEDRPPVQEDASPSASPLNAEPAASSNAEPAAEGAGTKTIEEPALQIAAASSSSSSPADGVQKEQQEQQQQQQEQQSEPQQEQQQESSGSHGQSTSDVAKVEEKEVKQEEPKEKKEKKDKKDKKEKKDKKDKKRKREKEGDIEANTATGQGAEDSSDSSEIDPHAVRPMKDHKTRMCFSFLEGRCHKGSDCVQAHSEELKQPGEALRDFEKRLQKHQAKQPRGSFPQSSVHHPKPAARTVPAMPHQHWHQPPMGMGHMMGMTAPHMMDPMMMHNPMGMMGMSPMMHGGVPPGMMHAMPHMNPHMAMMMEGSEKQYRDEKSKKRKEPERDREKDKKDKGKDREKGKDKHRDRGEDDNAKPNKDKKDKGKKDKGGKERKVDDEDL